MEATPDRFVQEQIRQQSEADEMCGKMRIDCEDLLNAQGVVKLYRPLSRMILPPPFSRGRVLESSILDDKGKPIEVTIFSTKVNPAKYSEIIVGTGKIYSTFDQPFLSLEKDHGNIKVMERAYIGRGPGGAINRVRRANLQDVREWRKVVDALKNQTNQISPIDHK